jgi:hypothetical protein
MHIDLKTPGVRLPRAHANALLLRVRDAFAGLAGRVLRVVVRVLPAETGSSRALCDCEVQVHLHDGQVEVVRERRHRLADGIGRALVRAWNVTGRRLGATPEAGTTRHLKRATVLPASAHASRRGAR